MNTLKTFLQLVCISTAFLSVIPSLAQENVDWRDWPKTELKNPTGQKLVEPGNDNSSMIFIYAVADLEVDFGKKLSEFGKSPADKLGTALSIAALSPVDKSYAAEQMTGMKWVKNKKYKLAAGFDKAENHLVVSLVPVERVEAAEKQAAAVKEKSDKQKPNANAKLTKTKFAAPHQMDEMFKWEKTNGITWVVDKEDAVSPRAFKAVSGPKYGYSSFEGAIKHLAKNAKINLTAKPVLRSLNAWKAWDGRTAKIVMAPTTIAGRRGVLVLYMTQSKGSQNYSMAGYEVVERDFLAWGGVTRLLEMRGVIPTVEAFPLDNRNKIARAPFRQQLDLYNAALTKQFNELAKGLMTTQAQTLLRMQELNYDLLLGGDISSPMIAN